MNSERIGVIDLNALERCAMSLRLPARPPWQVADRVSRYVAEFLEPDLNRLCGSPEAGSALAGDVAYAVNELLENAAKYSLPGAVQFAAALAEDEVILSLSHAVATPHAERYRSRAIDMVTLDPMEMLLATVERNALREGESESASGLGLLSLMSDYGARLGFAFVADAATASDCMRVTTQAHLPLRH